MHRLIASRRRLFTAAVLAALAIVVSVGVATASAGGGKYTNSSYAAKGGLPKPPKQPKSKKATQAQRDCESFGGTFSTDPADDRSGVVAPIFLWACNAVIDPPAAAGTLRTDCTNDGGNVFGSDSFDNPNLSCHRIP